jgi:DNA-binding LytR/AlgR family response regulator
MKNNKVLIVEDEPIIAADLEDRLIEMGCHVLPACSSGEAALLTFAETKVDLVLMDIQLGGKLDGIETAKQMLALAPVTLIYLTSNADETHFERARPTLPAAFLSKPFRGKDLKYAIELALSRAPKPPLATPENTQVSHILNDRLFVKVKDRSVRIFLSDILWVEADNYYCKIVTSQDAHLIGQTLKQIEAILLELPEFMRVHRSFLVNLTKIEAIGDGGVFIQKKQIPISKNAREALNIKLQRI